MILSNPRLGDRVLSLSLSTYANLGSMEELVSLPIPKGVLDIPNKSLQISRCGINAWIVGINNNKSKIYYYLDVR